MLYRRSFARAQARREADAARRAALLRRRAAAGGVVAGASLLLAPGAASAATFTVTETNSGVGPCGTVCTLPSALQAANDTAGADTIRFAVGVSGTIRLTQTLVARDASGLTIVGPGANALTVSGDSNGNGTPNTGDTRVFDIQQGNATISGLTISGGFVSGTGAGGAGVLSGTSGATVLRDVVVSGNRAGIDGDAGNDVQGGGVRSLANGGLVVRDSTVSGNRVTEQGAGGGVYADNATAETTIERSTIASNRAEGDGGGIAILRGQRARTTISGSTIFGNVAVSGGGVSTESKFGTTVTGSEVRNNLAVNGGGGIRADLGERSGPVRGPQADGLTVADSTIAGNGAGEASSSGGGGILFAEGEGSGDGGFEGRIVQSTIADNVARFGGGVSVGRPNLSGGPLRNVAISASTVAGNRAGQSGGGVYWRTRSASDETRVWPTTIDGTAVADNLADGAPEDVAFRTLTTDTDVTVGRSLVETPGRFFRVTQSPAGSVQTGVDPQLGPLADNGGTTRTLLPAATSPLLDRATAPAGRTLDQRGGARTVDDADVPNAAGSDGTDIGAVERQATGTSRPPTTTGPTTTGPTATAPQPPASTTSPTPSPTPSPFLVGVGFRSLLTDRAPDGGATFVAPGVTRFTCALPGAAVRVCRVRLRAQQRIVLPGADVARGALLAVGRATTAQDRESLPTKVELTAAGRRALRAEPLGRLVDAVAEARTSAGIRSVTGEVRLAPTDAFVIAVPGRAAALPAATLEELDRLGPVLRGVTRLRCVAHTSAGPRAVAITTAQAEAACGRLTAAGTGAETTPVGQGASDAVASNRTAAGRRANRRIVVQVVS